MLLTPSVPIFSRKINSCNHKIKTWLEIREIRRKSNFNVNYKEAFLSK